MPNTPTVRTLALSLGVSRTTVSEALRGNACVHPATAARIRSAAEAVGYKANPLVGAVMSEVRRSRNQIFRGVIAAIDLDETGRPAASGKFHAALTAGARQRALELGFKLETFLVGSKGVTFERLDTILQSRGIQGVMLLPSWEPPDFSKLDWTRYAGIYSDYVIDHPALHSVCSDHHRSLMSALGRLQALGYDRPGLVVQSQQDERLQHRWEGAFSAYQRNHPEIGTVPPLIVPEVNAANFSRWFRKYTPDVVLAHDPVVMTWMTAAGARVPRTHGYFCLNVTQTDRPCAGLDLHPHALGARGVELLIAQLQRNERGIPSPASTTMIPGHWVDGPTLAKKTGPTEKLSLKSRKVVRDSRLRSG
jgi:LacI family transcriptional regulator